jgi:acyl-CoA synthetase (AMP-forming)/AMP-acid ligase II
MRASYNIATSLVDQAQKHPYQMAVAEPAGRDRRGRPSYRQLNYQQLNEWSDTIASALQRHGLRKGQRVALMVPPSLDFFALTFGLFRAGAVPVLIDPGLGLKRIKTCLREAAPQAFVGIPKAHLARWLFGWQRRRWQTLIRVGGHFPGTIDLHALIAAEHNETRQRPPLVLPDDPAAILFTSGSTGSPKGALYTHRNFQAQIERLRETFAIQQGEIDLCTFPLFALFAPALGMSAIIPEMDFTRPGRVNPDMIFDPIERFGVQNLFGSPALIQRVSTQALNQRRKLPSLKRVVSAGAPVPAATIADMKASLPANSRIYTPYGATEALPVACLESHDILNETYEKTNQGGGICVGYPCQHTDVRIIRISDEPLAAFDPDMELPPGEIGEIIVSGPQVTRSYYNRQDATTLAKIPIIDTKDVFHRMGDVGYRDEHGRLWYCGRKSHRVITPHQTLFTIPCEAIFNTHADVRRTALVGVGPRPRQRPVLCVELTDPKTTGRTERDRILHQLKEHGAGYSLTQNIKTFLFHPGFPVDIRHNSKIFREKLSQWAEETLS